MAGFAECPYCRMQIPQLAEVCGHCQREVGWHGGIAYEPEEAAQQQAYTTMIWGGWPWLWHFAAAAVVTGGFWIKNGTASLLEAALACLTLMVVFAVPIYVFRWLYVRWS